MLPNLGFTEILILVGILVLFFGAKRIPEIGSSIGKGIKEFKRGLKEEHKEPEETSTSAVPPTSASGAPKRLNQ
jgi:sec-independent protein translocase protein TatA